MVNRTMRLLLIAMTLTEICAYLMIDYSYRKTDQRQRDITINEVSDILQLICNSLFTIEIVFGVIALGFVKGHNTFLRELWNIILLLILCCGWISRLDYESLIINIIKFLRILTFFRLFPELMKKVNAIFSSFQHLGKTFFPLICIITFYAVIGMSFFQGHVESRCRLTEHPEQGQEIWHVDETNELPCGYEICKQGTYCGNPADYGLPFYKKEAKTESLLFGYNIFNSIEWSLFAVYNFLMVTGWVQTTYMYWRAQDKAVSAIYFVSLVLFLSQVISNIILATLYEGFIDETSIKNQQLKKNKIKMHNNSLSEKGSQFINALDSGKPQQKKNVLFQIESEENQHGNDQNNISENKMNNKISEYSHQNNQYNDKSEKNHAPSISRILHNDHEERKSLNRGQTSYSGSSKSDPSPQRTKSNNLFLEQMATSPIMKTFFLLNIFLQLIVLCLDNHWIKPDVYIVLNQIDFATIVVLFVEIVYLIISLGYKNYFSDNINLIDVAIFLAHVISYLIEINDGKDIFNPKLQIYILIRCTKVFRFYKIFFHYELFQNMTVILKTYYQTLKSIPEYILVFCILVILFAQIGREIFAYTQPADDHHVLRVNFNTLTDSLIAVVLIFYNEEWHISMYNFMRFVGYKSVIYYLVCMLIGWVLFVRLFIAIFISQFMKWLRLNEQEYKSKEENLDTLDMIFKRCFISIYNMCNKKNNLRKVNILSKKLNQAQSIQLENLDENERQQEQKVNCIENGLFSKNEINIQQLVAVSPTTNNLSSNREIKQLQYSSINMQEDSDKELESENFNTFGVRRSKKPTIIGIRNSILQDQPSQAFTKLKQLQNHLTDYIQNQTDKQDHINISQRPIIENCEDGNQGTYPTERQLPLIVEQRIKQDTNQIQSQHQFIDSDYIQPKLNNNPFQQSLQASNQITNDYFSQSIQKSNFYQSYSKIPFFKESSVVKLYDDNGDNDGGDENEEYHNYKKAVNQIEKLNIQNRQNEYKNMQNDYNRNNHHPSQSQPQSQSQSLGVVGLNNKFQSQIFSNEVMFNQQGQNQSNFRQTQDIKIIEHRLSMNGSNANAERAKQQISRNQSNVSNTSHHEENIQHHDRSLFLFSADNPFRLFCIRISENLIFDIFMVISIIIFAVILVLDSPFLDPKSSKKMILNIIYYILAIIFSLELFIHLVQYGALINGSNSYLRKNITTILDFITTTATIVYVCNISPKVNYVFKCLAIFRIIFLLQFLSKYNKDIAFAGRLMSYCSSRMIKLIIFAMIYLFMNGIVITKLLKDSNWKCKQLYHPSSHNIVSKHDCYDLGGDWIENSYNFNSIVDSLQVLFMVQASEGWLQIMLDTFDSNTSDYQLYYRQQSIWSIFFIQYFFIANICILNMFVGLIVESLLELIEQEHGTNALTKQQKEWFFIKKSINKLVPIKKEIEPNNVIGKFLFRNMISGNSLKVIFYVFTSMNGISFLFFKNRIPQEDLDILNAINLSCLAVLGVEIGCRLLSLNVKVYFQSGWNIFDIAVLVIGSLNLNYQINHHITIFSNYYRIFDGVAKGIQLLRLIRVFNHFLIFRKLFNSLNYALSSILGISLILIVFLYTSVLLSLNLFPYLKFQSTINQYDINFQEFFQALFSFIRIVTLEMWYLIPFEASSKISPNFVCKEDMYSYDDFMKYGYQSCGSVISYVFFYGFFLIFTLIILNLFIATIIESYKEAFSADESAINHYQLDDILKLWTKYDPEGKGYISYKEFWQFSSQIAIVYGVNSSELLDIENKNKFLKTLNIPIYEDPIDKIFCYKFHDVVVKLSKISVQIKYGVTNLEPKNRKLRNDLDAYIKASSLKYEKMIKSTDLSSGDMILIIVLSRKVKQWKKKYIEKVNGEEANMFNIQSLFKRVQTTKQTFLQQIKDQIKKEEEKEIKQQQKQQQQIEPQQQEQQL